MKGEHRGFSERFSPGFKWSRSINVKISRQMAMGVMFSLKSSKPLFDVPRWDFKQETNSLFLQR